MSTAEQTAVSPKQQFLDAYDREHRITMRVLRAYPTDKLDLQPHSKLKNARELAWMFVLERYLGMSVYNDAFADAAPGEGGAPPPAPASWDELLDTLERVHGEFGDMVRSTPSAELNRKVHFFRGPKTMGEYTRLEFCWFLLCDQIHHRGQFSVYLRMADGKVPSIYGPTHDEPWT
jgi:uncharacterized damage-inducible protein DinB